MKEQRVSCECCHCSKYGILTLKSAPFEWEKKPTMARLRKFVISKWEPSPRAHTMFYKKREIFGWQILKSFDFNWFSISKIASLSRHSQLPSPFSQSFFSQTDLHSCYISSHKNTKTTIFIDHLIKIQPISGPSIFFFSFSFSEVITGNLILIKMYSVSIYPNRGIKIKLG